MTVSILTRSKHRSFSYEFGQNNHLRFCNSLRSSGIRESGEISGYALVPTILLVLEMFLLCVFRHIGSPLDLTCGMAFRDNFCSFQGKAFKSFTN